MSSLKDRTIANTERRLHLLAAKRYMHLSKNRGRYATEFGRYTVIDDRNFIVHGGDRLEAVREFLERA